MNLLTDPWIPIQQQGHTRLLTLQQLLCEEGDYTIALTRDDMELACLQLLVCLTQVLFLPEDREALLRRMREPLSDTEYQQGIQPYIDWFDLRHEKWPFMQTRGVSAKEPTPIQKLFVGLPEGNNHAFFNEPGEISAISEAAVAIALFNQAMNSPSFGGGFKGGFRGGAPITTLMAGPSLRHTIWFNVLHKQHLKNILPNIDDLSDSDKPTWVDPIKEKSSIAASEIGLLRGLFWQPAHLELQFSEQSSTCNVLGIVTEFVVTEFLKEKFVYEIVGNWTHPHSPRVYDLKNNALKYLTFTTTAPAWTQLNHLLVASENKKEAREPAEVVKQFRKDFAEPGQLIVGGYRNKQASILQRRHEFFPLRPGWDKDGEKIAFFVELALEIKQVLKKSVWVLGKNAGVSKEKPKRKRRKDKPEEDNWIGLQDEAEVYFYHQSEPLIHQALREIDWNEPDRQLARLRDELINLSWQIFDQVTSPYAHEPQMIQALATAKTTLGAGFKKLKGTPS